MSEGYRTAVCVVQLGVCVVFLLSLQNVNGAAILFPDEVSSLASVLYSLLPPIKLGQDSRFGFGFRLGRNADAQVLVELGPQKDTVALGESSAKRQTNDKVSEASESSKKQRRAQIWRSVMEKMEKTVRRNDIKNI